MKEQENREKSYKIQLLRGLAILAVVFIHNTPGGKWSVVSRPFLNFSVGMFLFLSGMLSSAQKWNPQKRIRKVIIPYILWTLIYVVLYNIKTLQAVPQVFLTALVKGDAAAMMYYVFVYCEFTLLIPMIDKLARSKYKYVGFIIMPAEIILMRLGPMLIGYQIGGVLKAIMHVSCMGWFTYFYLGYLLGNNLLQPRMKERNLIFALGGGIVLQVLEGLLYLSFGNANCGTQLKLSAVLTGAVVILLAYRFIESDKKVDIKWIEILGNYSFGIYFSHIAVMWALGHLENYTRFVCYPFNALFVTAVSLICVSLGRQLLGKYAKYLAL